MPKFDEMEVMMAHVDEGHRDWDSIQTFEYLMKDLRHDPREARKQDALFAALARLTEMREGLKVNFAESNFKSSDEYLYPFYS